jgi:valyl-tRNA synthetase
MANYNPAERETHRQSFWLENNIYAFDPTSPKPLFSVDTPPPTVSGKLHIGHIFSYTQAECLVRYKRMA